MTDSGRAPSGQALVQAPSPSVSALTGFDPSRVRAWLAAMGRQGEDRIWRGARQADAYVQALEAERDAYRTQAINRGWNWNLCDAYGRAEYERHLANEIDRTAENMLGRPPIREMFAMPARPEGIAQTPSPISDPHKGITG